MCGVHYRFDSEEGLILGEIVAVRLLQQVRTRKPKPQPFTPIVPFLARYGRDPKQYTSDYRPDSKL